MRLLMTFSLAAAVVAAAPPPSGSTLEKRMPQGSINWFTRWDCTNPCVEDGLCLSGQMHKGTKESVKEWIGWDAGCWDRPDNVHSLALSMNNEKGFTGMTKTCAEYKKDPSNTQTWKLLAGEKFSDHHCNVFKGDKIKAVYYNW